MVQLVDLARWVMLPTY
ncbi:hypothetical protein OFC47_24310 [Escherichia coli]|nr:hypothetical protein [Escherichia coli]